LCPHPKYKSTITVDLYAAPGHYWRSAELPLQKGVRGPSMKRPMSVTAINGLWKHHMAADITEESFEEILRLEKLMIKTVGETVVEASMKERLAIFLGDGDKSTIPLFQSAFRDMRRLAA
jgi:hypothetical protein